MSIARSRSLFLVLLSIQLGTLTGHAQAQTDFLYDNASDGSPILNLINKASRSIDVEIYEMSDLTVIAALQRAAQRGVRLRIVQDGDPYDSTCKVFSPQSPSDGSCGILKKFVAWVRANKGTYVPFNTKTLCAADAKFCFEHGKMIIADSAYALISTGNFNASNLCDTSQHATICNRDYTVLTNDANVIKALSIIFQLDLAGNTYDLRSILTSGIANRITVSPYSMSPLVQLIQSARASILIQNQYLNDPTINQALIDAGTRGVKVFVDVTSVCNFKRPDPVTTQHWTQVFSAFDAAGIQSRMFTEKMSLNNLPGYLHAKAILVDGARLWVGSVNGSTQSLNINREFGILLTDANSIRKFSQLFSTDFKNQYSEDWKESLACKFDNPK